MGDSGPGFREPEAACARALIELALAEDLGEAGDVTAAATIPEQARGVAAFVARRGGVLCGMPVVEMLAARFGLEVWPSREEGDSAPPPAAAGERAARLSHELDDPAPRDGTTLQAGATIAYVGGPMRAILGFERTALNFLQRLSGVATMTARFVEAARGTRAVILDTRKTTPGWRALEKYAVRCGGGRNHRIGLYDAVLIKDNHLAYLAEGGDPIGRAIAAGRAAVPPGTTVEVEVDGLEQLDRALECGPDIVLLDNFEVEAMAEAVRRRDARAPGVLLEASGGVNLETVRAIALTGVDRISVGALTHSAPALDVALDVR
jgi:nicotinate-nucleotide pyrophosphorylase (carboxylating)